MQTLADQSAAGTGGDTDRNAATPAVRSVTSAELLQGERLLVIRHGEAAYRLQVTQGGKLILTK